MILTFESEILALFRKYILQCTCIVHALPFFCMNILPKSLRITESIYFTREKTLPEKYPSVIYNIVIRT